MKMPKNSHKIQPQKGSQTEFFKRANITELAYLGEVGGGKSFCILLDALGLQYKTPAIENPEYRAVIFRKNYTEIAELVKISKQIYAAPPLNGEFVMSRRGEPGQTWMFPSGAKIWFSYIDSQEAAEIWQGYQLHYAAFDEVTYISPESYLYIFSRLRSTIPELFTRMRCTGNVIGPYASFYRKRFVDALAPGEIGYFGQDPEHDILQNPAGIKYDKKTDDTITRSWVPSKLKENKYLATDKTYIAGIQQLGKKKADALLHADWDYAHGTFFSEFDLLKNEADPFSIPEEWELFSAGDPGYAAATAFILMARDFSGNVYVLFTYGDEGIGAKQHAQAIHRRISSFKYTGGRLPQYSAWDPAAWAKRDRHALIANELTFADFLEEQMPSITFKRAQNDRIQGWWAIKNLMAENRLFIFKDYNKLLIEQLIDTVPDEKNPEDIDRKTSSTKHYLDALRYGIMSIDTPIKAPEPQKSEGIWNTEDYEEKDIRTW